MKALFVVFLIIVACCFSSAVSATTYYVNGTTGDDLYDGLAAAWDGVHGPKKTIQAGIDASTDTDTVQVADGTYTGDGNRDLTFLCKAITLRSENGPENTIIDCEGTESEPHRGFYFYCGEGPDSVVEGFTICNGYANSGGAIYCHGSSPTITGCIITDNTSAGPEPTFHGGGGIYCYDSSSPRIESCTIAGNTAANEGGGVYCLILSDATITNCTIRDNTAGGAGGGIRCVYSNAEITECSITGNVAGWGGRHLRLLLLHRSRRGRV